MTLSGYQRRAIEALLTTKNVSAAADKAGLTRTTLHNYLNDADFRSALARAESEALGHLARSMASASTKALARLEKILDDPDASRSEQIRAARAILANLPPVRLLGSIESRLNELELEK